MAHGYPAAKSSLGLLFGPKKSKKVVAELCAAELAHCKAKDIFRASGLSFLGVSNSHVEKGCNKINEGKKLSPILLVKQPDQEKMSIADGYHRLYALYRTDEDALDSLQDRVDCHPSTQIS